VIPKVIHRIWLGSSLPAAAAELGGHWERLFPDYRLELWTDERLLRLGMPRRWFAARTYAERSDVARYLLLDRFGGVYADCDVEPLARFDALWAEGGSFVAFRESPDLVWNGVIASAPGQRVLRIASALAARGARLEDPDAAPNVRTGPFVFTMAVEYAQAIDDTGMLVCPCGFAHVRGEPTADAVVSSPFRDPPSWAAVDPQAPGRPRLGPTVVDAVRTRSTLASMAPVRLRRRLRRQAGQP